MPAAAGAQWRENVAQVKRLAAVDGREGLSQFITAEQIDATRCYNLTKEAIILWTMAEAEAMTQRDLRMNTLNPGGTATGIFGDFQRAFGAPVNRNIKRAGRAGKPEEIAAFVLSPAANWLKGADTAIEGGMGAFNPSDTLELQGLRPG